MKFGLRLNALVFFVFYAHTPLALFANAGHDDRNFTGQAWHLIHGEWLGNFTQFAIMKGPGYGFFLALNALLGLPLPIAHALFHLLCVNFFAWVVGRISHSQTLQITLAVLLTWHPVLMCSRAIRDAIYSGQTLLVIGLWAWLFTSAKLRGWRQAGLATLTGAATAWFWLTREEGVWLVPGLTCLVIGCAIVHGRRDWQLNVRKLALAVASYIVCTQSVAAINYVRYGGWVAVDTKEANFVEALSLLGRIQSHEPVSQVPVPLDVREAVYRVSPAFASLEPHFQSAVEGWAHAPLARPPHRDFSGAVFMWVFRDAAASQGHYKSEATAAAFYKSVAADVRGACASGALSCQQGWLNYLPPLSKTEAVAIVPTWAKSMVELVGMSNIETQREYSSGPVDDVLDLLNYPRIWPLAVTAGTPEKLPWGTKRVLEIKTALKRMYPWMMTLAIIGSIASMLAIWLRRSNLAPAQWQLLLIAMCCWGSIAVRCLLLTVLDITSFGGLNPQYMGPCYYLLVAAAAVTTYVGVTLVEADEFFRRGHEPLGHHGFFGFVARCVHRVVRFQNMVGLGQNAYGAYQA